MVDGCPLVREMMEDGGRWTLTALILSSMGSSLKTLYWIESASLAVRKLSRMSLAPSKSEMGSVMVRMKETCTYQRRGGMRAGEA